ncbi:DNA repair protein RecO [Candidatus Uhrbacteria bacterium]|nr:DNA repair protein RecO [Candidatus Uhrbacteria bacterium]
MSYLRDVVIVLKKEPFREQDRRYVMYGKEYGLLSAVARGASLRTSKQAGHLEPFTESDIMIAEGSVFDKLAVAHQINAATDCPRTLAGLSVCGAFSDLLLNLIRPGVSDARIFLLLRELIQTVAHLSQELSSERTRLLFAAAALQLLDILGFGPPITAPASARNLTTPVPSLVLLSFIRRSSLIDVLRVTVSVEVLRQVCVFVEDALRNTSLQEEPKGLKMLRSLV